LSIDEKLPDGWVETTIGNIADINPGTDTFSLPESTLVSFVPMAAVEAHTGRMDSSNIRRLSEVRRGYTAFQENDVLFAKITPCMENGKFVVAQSLSSGIGFGSTEFHVLRSEKEINPHLLYYYLSQKTFRQAARSAMTGTAGQLRVPTTFLQGASYPLAPTNEQNRIVAAIEQQFTRLDSAVASLRSAKARVKQYRTSLLKSAVEGELTKEWRIEHPGEETGEQLLKRILAERRKHWEEAELAKMREKGIVPRDNKWKQAYKEPLEPDIKDLPVLPGGWCWATVEQVAQIQGGIQKQPSRAPRQNAYPYLRVANVLRGRLDLSVIEKMELFKNELETLRLKRGDLLIVEGNGSRTEIGRSALWNEEIKDCVHQNHIIRVRLNHVMPKYVDFYWNSPEGNQHVMDVAASTTGLYTLSINKISRLPIPLPPLAEQEQIVAEVEASLSNIAKLEEATENNLKRAEHERQSILLEAFAGHLVLQDMNDEPASVLLERIREERKKREEAEKIVKASRKGDHVGSVKRPRIGRVASGQRNIGLYEKLVEAGQPLAPDYLFKQVGLKADDQPESVETFYEELHADVVTGLIEEGRPTTDRVLLYVVKQDDENLEKDEKSKESNSILANEMQQDDEWLLPNLEELGEAEIQEARDLPSLDLEELPEGKMWKAIKEDDRRPSLWDE
jgi:type I restriction enzyme, S subunit